MKCGLLGSEAGKGRPLDLGRMFANDAKTVYLGRIVLQGDHSGRLQPPVDLVPTVLAASGPLLQLPTAQAG